MHSTGSTGTIGKSAKFYMTAVTRNLQ